MQRFVSWWTVSRLAVGAGAFLAAGDCSLSAQGSALVSAPMDHARVHFIVKYDEGAKLASSETPAQLDARDGSRTTADQEFNIARATGLKNIYRLHAAYRVVARSPGKVHLLVDWHLLHHGISTVVHRDLLVREKKSEPEDWIPLANNFSIATFVAGGS